MVTQEQIVELQGRCVAIAESGRAFFAQAGGHFPGYVLPAGTSSQAETLRTEIRNLTARLLETATFSPLVGREDINDATTAMKIALAALRFKNYQSWDTHVLHDEDIVLGVCQAGQIEVDTDAGTALRRFEEAMLKLTDFAALLVPGQTKTMISEDDRFARMAIEEARKSVSENDGRPHPKVGAVVVKDGQVLATAHRGEAKGNHAEFIALEKRLADAAVAGATVYTTLEPCTTRNHPKIPCVERLIERKVKRVVIGMLDPDPRITGRGQRRLRSASIVTDFFAHELMTEVEELNREFTRTFEAARPVAAGTIEQLGGVTDKWVSLDYVQRLGIDKALAEQGYELHWSSADKEAERVDLAGWEHVIVDEPAGTKARLKIRDSPVIGGYMVLLKKRKLAQ
jgi:pyrimidine deaminase RibD-like protein